MNLSTHKKSEVDLRVAQELKNNQDFIYQTNQTLQSLSQGMVSLSISFEKMQAKIGSDHKAISIKFENLTESLEKKYKVLFNSMSGFESDILLITSLTQSCLNTLDDEKINDSLFEKKLSITYEYLNSLNESIEKTIKNNQESEKRIYSTLRNEIENVKKDLTPIIPEEDPIKKALDERFAILKVDFDGLIKEIALLKKAVAYDEKKFENVYTLIERLKAGNE